MNSIFARALGMKPAKVFKAGEAPTKKSEQPSLDTLMGRGFSAVLKAEPVRAFQPSSAYQLRIGTGFKVKL